MITKDQVARFQLSARGEALVTAPPMPEYEVEHSSRSLASGESRYAGMCVAENRLMWDILAPKMAACRDVPHRVLGYDSMIGSARFRDQLARFMSLRVLGRQVDAAHVAVLAGAGSVLETMFYALGDPGDGVLVPTPSYAGFWLDLETRNQLEIVPVHRRAEDGFRLSFELLEAAREKAVRPIKALVFTSPDNPLGRVFERAEVEEVLRWADSAGVHVVFDEVYALSVFGDRAFTSCGRLRSSLGDRVHVVWAFSKDFAASGLRCGVLVTENQALMAAVEELAYWACCSGDTQYVLGEMIVDDEWVEHYVEAMQARLGDAYRQVTASLATQSIPFIPADAGFFVLVDLRSFLREPSWQAEHALWRRILDHAEVNLTPGSACRAGEPGFMRLCFAGMPTADAVAAVERIGPVLHKGVASDRR